MPDDKVENPEGSAADEDEEDLFQADDDDGGGEAVKPEIQTPGDTGESKTDAAEPTVESASVPVSGDSEPASTLTPTETPATAEATAGKGKEDKPAVLSTDAPIPRVSAPPPSPSSAAKAGNGGKYGLPADIVVPATITPSLLQGRLLETLRSLPKQLINDALVEYDDAVQVKGESIRNRGAYLYGVVKRYVSVQERATSGEGEGILPMGPDLTPAVNERLGKLVQDQFCTQDEMNEKVKSKIRMLSEKDALFAIEELSSADRGQIRNFGSYFMGILNRYMRGERKDVTSGKKTLAEVRHSFQQQQSPHMHRNDDRRRDDRFQRGRDSEPQYRRARDASNSRDRSRDRVDMGGRRDSHDFQAQYDPRNQQQQQRPPYYGQPPLGGNHPPPPPPRPPGMPGGPGPYQQPPPSYAGQNPATQMQNLYGQQGPPHHAPPPAQQYAPPPMGGPPPGNQYSSQYMPPQHGMGDRQPPNQQYGQPPQNLVPQHTGVPGLPPLQGGSSMTSYGAPSNQQVPPYTGMNQQQQSYSTSPYSPPPPAPNRYSQPGGPPDAWGNQTGMQNPPQSPAPAVDILALADKASSAVQALQNQNKFQIPPYMAQQQQPPPSPYQPGVPPQPYGQPQFNAPLPYQPMQQPYGQQQHQIPGQQPDQGLGGGKRRRTTANIAELPVTVQYAIQNLQATGQINGPLDDGMLGMVKDLPENLALQALQKFASLDKNTMRNKTAYLAGLLRRELEKIHKR